MPSKKNPPPSLEKRFLWRTFLMGFFTVLLFLSLLHVPFIRTHIYQPFELKLLDVKLHLFPPPPFSKKIVVFTIDDNSENLFGTYPWPRSYYAHALQSLHDLGAAATLFDIEFKPLTRPPLEMGDKNSSGESSQVKETLNLAQAIQNFQPIFLPFSLDLQEKQEEKSIDPKLFQSMKTFLLKNFRLGDSDIQKLAGSFPLSRKKIKALQEHFFTHLASEAISQKGILDEVLFFQSLGFKSLSEANDKLPSFDFYKMRLAFKTALGEYWINRRGLPLPSSSSVQTHLIKASQFETVITPELTPQAAGIGPANIVYDEDQVIRRLPLFYQYHHRLYPYFIFSAYLHLYARSWKFSPDGTHLLIYGQDKKNPVSIPLDRHASMIIHWAPDLSPRPTSGALPAIAEPTWRKTGIHADEHYLSISVLLQIYRTTYQIVDPNFPGLLGQLGKKLFPPGWQDLDSHVLYGKLYDKGQVLIQLWKAWSEHPTASHRNALRQKLLSTAIDTLDLVLHHQLFEQKISNEEKALEPFEADPDSADSPTVVQKKEYIQSLKRALSTFKSLLPLFKEELLLRKTYASLIQNKICLIGVGAKTGGDFKATPIDNYYPGVLVTAQALNTLLQEDFITPLRPWSNTLCALGMGWLMVLLASFLALTWTQMVLPLIFVLGSFTLVNAYLFEHAHTDVAFVGPIAASFLGFLSVTTYRALSEQRQRREIKKMFEHYMTPSALDALLKDPSKVRLGGERRIATSFFSDLEGFTKFSEGLEPEEVVATLNQYLTVITGIIFRYGGFLDKYEGDGVMACFGVPLPTDQDAANACLAALEIRQAVQKLARELEEKEGRSPLNIRIGIHTGPMIVGNIGSENRFDYTTIGDTVNLASRLEGANKAFGTGLMISEETYRTAHPALAVRELDMILVKGKARPIRVYEVLDVKAKESEYREWTAVFEQGLQHYRNQAWDQAIACFEKVKALRGKDSPSETMIERCRTYQQSPPSPDWDGTHFIPKK